MTELSTLKEQVCNSIDKNRDMLLSISHEIHSNPELAFEEFKASKLLSDESEKVGMNVVREAYGLETAYASDFGNDGPRVAILSEYDALPGIGHSCGHNIIATTGFGAAAALLEVKDSLPGSIRYLGTPAEERGGGKEFMAQEGAFEEVSAAMMVHPAGVDLSTMPSICVSEVQVTYKGRSAHASAIPHMGINALDALVTAYQAIAQLRQHIKQTERIHGIFEETGFAPNIVPEVASGKFFVRAANAQDLAPLKARVQGCFEAGATATGCNVDIKWAAVDYLDIKTNWPLAEAYERNATELGREFLPLEKMSPSSAGSTDMGNISHRVPSIHPLISCAPPEVVIHNPEFAKWAASDLGDQSCIDGAKSLAMTALDFLFDEELQEKASTSFKESEENSKEVVKLSFNPDGDTSIGGCGCC